MATAPRWSFHSAAIVSGSSDVEAAALREVLQTFTSSSNELSSWARPCSYRLVERAQVEEVARITAQERQIAAEAAKLAADPAAAPEPSEPVTRPRGPSILTPAMELTPQTMADAFQRLVLEDRRSFERYWAPPDAAIDDSEVVSELAPAPSTTPTEAEAPLFTYDARGSADPQPARVFLLLDYPSSLAETQELLRRGEAPTDDGAPPTRAPQDSPLPLLPLLDGLILLVEPERETRQQRKTVQEGGAERRKSITKQQFAADVDTQEAVRPKKSVFQTANQLVSAVYDASTVGGLEWSDFVFAELDCASRVTKEPTPAEDLVRELIALVEPLAKHKFAFKQWVSSTIMTPLPALEPSKNSSDTSRACYDQILSRVCDASIGVSTLLFALKEAVAMALEAESDEADEENEANNQQRQSYELEAFIDHGDVASIRLARSCLHHHYLREQSNQHQEENPCRVHGQRIDEIEKDMWARSDLPGVGNGGRKRMPKQPELSATIRSVLDTESSRFTDPITELACVHRTRQLLQLEQTLGAPWHERLRSRTFAEYLDSHILPQRLAAILGNSPTVHMQYDPRTDSLLLAIVAATAPGRLRTSSWSARDHVRHRPAFKEWKREEAVPEEYLTPRTALATSACVPLSSGELAQVSEKCWTLFPSDQSVVRVRQTPRGHKWLSVYQQGEVFGLRPTASESAMQFVASLQDGSLVQIAGGKRDAWPLKPDGFSTVTMTNTFPCGLSVLACSDGTIVQRYALPPIAGSGSDDNVELELYRVITGHGSVVRVLQGGKKQILLASGAASSNKSRASSLLVDPETNTLVERYADGVLVATRPSGARVTYHADGTTMTMNSTRSHVLVQHPRFAEVWVDLEVNAMASRHAMGQRVAVTKGGLRTRSIVTVYDGTRIELGYNTKVIAQVNGRVTMTKLGGGLCVVAKDSGRVEYYPSMTLSHGERSKDNDDLDVTSERGVYYFDLHKKSFELCDAEQNEFIVELEPEGEREDDLCPTPRIAVALAGVVSDSQASRNGVTPIAAQAVINDPIEPHVLLLQGDGTGVELLRPCDIGPYLQTLHSSKAGEGSKHQTFLDIVRLNADKADQPPPFNDPALLNEMRTLQRPVALVARHLLNYTRVPSSAPQFTVVRRLEQLEPLAPEQLQRLQQALDQWTAWQEAREINKDQYAVFDPRDAETLAQEQALQARVLAASKATRARKKLERQKAREQRHKTDKQSQQAAMETVHEGDEHSQTHEHSDESGSDEFDQFGSDDSDDGGDADPAADVEDPTELLWTAFSEADSAKSGLLTTAQVRRALVHVLGAGVTSAELAQACKALQLKDPSQISFDLFADLVAYFKSSSSPDEASSVPSSPSQLRLKLTGSNNDGSLVMGIAAGSATEAVRKYSRN